MGELRKQVDEINEQLSTLHVHLMNIDAAGQRIKRPAPQPTEGLRNIEPQLIIDSLSDQLDEIIARTRGLNNLAANTEKHLSELI